MPAPDLSGYIEVKDRIAAFHAKYPEGSLQSSWRTAEIGEQTLIVAEARAYRTPTDPRPGMGWASEPFPGQTPYTRDSELMNAETSAWGRALAALGFEVSRSIASREEVQSRQGGDRKPTQGQLDFLLGKGKRQGLIDAAPFSDEAKVRVKAWVSDRMTFDQAGVAIEALKRKDPNVAVVASMAGFSDVPGDTEGLTQEMDLT